MRQLTITTQESAQGCERTRTTLQKGSALKTVVFTMELNTNTVQLYPKPMVVTSALVPMEKLTLAPNCHAHHPR